MTYKTFKPKFALCFDTETSGFNFPDYAEKHQMISYGAAIVVNETLEVVDTLYREIKFDDSKLWSKEAEAVHGLTKDYLNINGVSMEDACVDLLNLVVKYWGFDSSIMLIGHNPLFDVAFLNSSFDKVTLPHLKLYHRLIDTSIIGYATMNITNSEELFTKLGLPPRHAHNALEDVLYTVESVKIVRDYFKGYEC